MMEGANPAPLFQCVKPMRPVRIHLPHLPSSIRLNPSTRRLLRSFRENVQLGTLLAFVAGNVNSVAFVHFGTYVSHVSGHATRAAINYAEGDFTSALLFLMEFLAFIFGAGFTAFLLKGHTAASSQIKYTLPTFIELALIVSFMVLAILHAKGLIESPYLSHLTFLLAIAMGMQNAMLRQASGTIVRTTHMTGVATDFGFELGAAVRAAGDSFWMSEKSLLQKIRQSFDAFVHRLGVSRFLFHGFIIFSFSAGAVVGTLSFLLYQDYALLIPCITLLLIGIREKLRTPNKEEDTSGANI
ncbi:MAG: DUF1275 domain-containing protein [Proteobacteria bacterium]|nr:MAG: DUF1275 domain-containing protein [Pseudomonadota bacterium]